MRTSVVPVKNLSSLTGESTYPNLQLTVREAYSTRVDISCSCKYLHCSVSVNLASMLSSIHSSLCDCSWLLHHNDNEEMVPFRISLLTLIYREKPVVKVNLKQSCLVIVVSMLVDRERHLVMKTQHTVNVITRRTGNSAWQQARARRRIDDNTATCTSCHAAVHCCCSIVPWYSLHATLYYTLTAWVKEVWDL